MTRRSSHTEASDNAPGYGALALSFIADIDGLATTSAVLQSFQKAMSSFGFEHFVMSDVPSVIATAPPQVMLAKIPIGWAELYIERNYQQLDPIVHLCRRTSRPFAWPNGLDGVAPTGAAAEVMERARDFGLLEGFTCPIHGWDGAASCVSLSASAKLQLDRQTQPAIHLMAIYAFERVRELREGQAPAPAGLSAREREVLTWAAAGKSAAGIAKILNITERTAIAHTVNATHKLGASNKTQAVAKALQNKLINI